MKNLISNLRYDLPSSLVVFLIAVPLCLGIALACHVPLYSGLLAGVIGGIVIGALSGSQLSVSGPAAGLTAVVLTAVATLGSFEAFLLSVFLAGALQLTLGFLKAGTIVNYFPSSVIKGMLTAIGIIIILKQLPHAFGYDKDTEGDLYFLQPDGENTFSALLQPLYHIDTGATIIALISLVLLIAWEKIPLKKLRFLPGALVAVAVGAALNELWKSTGSAHALGAEHLVSIPTSDLAEQLRFPDWTAWKNPQVYLVAFTIAVVASIETLLCIEAIDKIDPERRVTPSDRELKAQGVGNMLSGLLGGLPITSVIVRSSANLNNGAKTKASTIIHGLLILSSVLLIPNVINMIPLASLAAILIMTGYKLAKISVFREMFRRGIYQWLPFMLTVIAVVFTDLLTGVAVGMAVAGFLILRINMKAPYHFQRETYNNGEHIVLKLSREVSFLTRGSIKLTLDSLPDNSKVTIDASDTLYVDDDVLELIRDFKEVKAPLHNINVHTVALRESYSDAGRSYRVLRHNAMLRKLARGQQRVAKGASELYEEFSASPLNIIRVLDRETLDAITPQLALKMLKAGNERFVNNLKFHRNLLQQVNETKEQQYPFAIVLSCIDSRTSAELIFDQGLGDIFSVRIAGNVINEDILGSMEFATQVAGAKIVVVLGHTKCGAVKGALQKVELGHLTPLLAKLKPAIERSELPALIDPAQVRYEHVDAVAAQNVQVMVEEIEQRSEILHKLRKQGRIDIVGGMYDIETGQVSFFEKEKKPEKMRNLQQVL